MRAESGGPCRQSDSGLTAGTSDGEAWTGEQCAPRLGQTAPRGKTPARPGGQPQQLRALHSTRASTLAPDAAAAPANCGPGSRPAPTLACRLDETAPRSSGDAPAAPDRPGRGGPAPRRST